MQIPSPSLVIAKPLVFMRKPTVLLFCVFSICSFMLAVQFPQSHSQRITMHYPRFLQTLGMTRNRIGKISSRPRSISKQSTIFDAAEKNA